MSAQRSAFGTPLRSGAGTRGFADRHIGTDAAAQALMLGALAYLVGLWNTQMLLNEKGYYLTLLLYGLFAAVSVQKAVRDRMEGIPVTNIYYGLAWTSVMSALVLLCIGLLWDRLLVPVLWVMLVLTVITAIQRFVKVWRQAQVAPVIAARIEQRRSRRQSRRVARIQRRHTRVQRRRG